MDRLKLKRREAGLTQQRFSEMFKIPPRTVQSWEEGLRKPPEYVIELILKQLDIYIKENKDTIIPLNEFGMKIKKKE